MTTLNSSKHKPLLTRIVAVGITLAVTMPLAATPADARAGGGFSFGSRGTRTFSAPPTTMTAPRPAAPMQRTETPSFGTQAPGIGSNAFGQRRFGFGSGLAAGLLGAGLLGMLTGNGFFGGLGGLASMFGLLLQIGLIVLVVRFALNFFRGRGRPAYAGSGPMNRSPFGGLGATFGGLAGGGGPRPSTPVTIEQKDFAAFERMLSEVQYSYAREDLTALGRLTTPEMLRHLSQDLEANRQRGVRNDLADVRLAQGDISEAWREGASDFATVAMRFAMRDTMVDRSSGRVISGEAHPVEATELWTFQRKFGAPWQVSAIQQVG